MSDNENSHSSESDDECKLDEDLESVSQEEQETNELDKKIEENEHQLNNLENP